MAVTEASKQLGEQWKKLSDSEKVFQPPYLYSHSFCFLSSSAIIPTWWSLFFTATVQWTVQGRHGPLQVKKINFLYFSIPVICKYSRFRYRSWARAAYVFCVNGVTRIAGAGFFFGMQPEPNILSGAVYQFCRESCRESPALLNRYRYPTIIRRMCG